MHEQESVLFYLRTDAMHLTDQHFSICVWLRSRNPLIIAPAGLLVYHIPYTLESRPPWTLRRVTRVTPCDTNVVASILSRRALGAAAASRS